MYISDLRSWPILRILKQDLISQINMVFVYGKLGNEALIVRKDKMMYSLNKNLNDCLGIKDKDSILDLKKVEDLYGRVKDVCILRQPLCSGAYRRRSKKF